MRRLFLHLAQTLCALASCNAGAPVHSATIDFERDVAPLLTRRCVECHNAIDRQGGLDLTSQAGFQVGGDSGRVINGSDASASRLLQRVAAGEMPPPLRGASRQLPSAEINVLKNWFDANAMWPDGRILDRYEQTTDTHAGRDWWSLLPVERPVVPLHASEAGDIANPIDAFINEKLLAEDLLPAPLADSRTLIRRATIDLWGLPPTVEEIEEFVTDAKSDHRAYERLIDRLLASPRYAERWARHWLDVVRFADTCGFERDQIKPNIWKYRDWVIQAFNSDMPYSQFVVEQLAGDEIAARTESSVTATGMLRAGAWNDEPNDPADYVYERLEDMVHVASSAFLGLTVKCARCHDHKFDPIKQEDYYRIASFFWAGYIGQTNLGGPSPEELGFDVFDWTDVSASPEPLRLLIKGERHRPGPIVEPGYLSAIATQSAFFSSPPREARTTHRRRQFAEWLIDPQHPLTARVMVNRLWHHHFGAGLVRSTNNFGFKGDLPTHPELLDWLAAELIDGGWRLKRIHRLIMTSRVYRQACDHPLYDQYAQRDYANQWLWHRARQRMDAETIRDALLQASGDLQLAMGGPSFFPRISPEALEGLSRKDAAWTESSPDERMRRSVYMIAMRSRILPLMTVFDFCDTTLPCGQRDVSTVPTQALALLNNEFVHEQSTALAERIVRQSPDRAEEQVELAFRAVLARSPDESESRACRRHLDEQFAAFTSSPGEIRDQRVARAMAVASLCHVLMNANEFIYVE